MSFQNKEIKHGGHREGAGRPIIGTTKKVSVTLPDEAWEEIMKDKGELTMAAYIRNVLVKNLEGSR